VLQQRVLANAKIGMLIGHFIYKRSSQYIPLKHLDKIFILKKQDVLNRVLSSGKSLIGWFKMERGQTNV
jgi:hypothetical protein